MEELLRFLNSIHPLSSGLIEYLSIHLKEKNLSRKDYLLKAGQTCRHIYFIEEGLLRCFYLKGEVEVSSWFMKEGDVITSIGSFFNQKESYESIQALEACHLYYIDFNELQHIYNNFSEFNFISRVLLQKYYIIWDQQLYGLRMQQAQERYNWLMEAHPEIILRVPAKFIASYLGITEVTLSKLKAR